RARVHEDIPVDAELEAAIEIHFDDLCLDQHLPLDGRFERANERLELVELCRQATDGDCPRDRVDDELAAIRSDPTVGTSRAADTAQPCASGQRALASLVRS